MQFKLSVVLLGLIVLMIALAGCSSTGSNSTGTATLSGSVLTPSGGTVSNATLTLYQSGNMTPYTQLSANTAYVLSSVASGTYTVQVTGPLSGEQTFLGPLVVGAASQMLNIITPTALSQLPPGNVSSPVDSSTTLVVIAVNSSGVPISQSFSVSATNTSGSTSTANSQLYNTYQYAVIPEVQSNASTTNLITVNSSIGNVTISNVSSSRWDRVDRRGALTWHRRMLALTRLSPSANSLDGESLPCPYSCYGIVTRSTLSTAMTGMVAARFVIIAVCHWTFGQPVANVSSLHFARWTSDISCWTTLHITATL